MIYVFNQYLIFIFLHLTKIFNFTSSYQTFLTNNVPTSTHQSIRSVSGGGAWLIPVQKQLYCLFWVELDHNLWIKYFPGFPSDVLELLCLNSQDSQFPDEQMLTDAIWCTVLRSRYRGPCWTRAAAIEPVLHAVSGPRSAEPERSYRKQTASCGLLPVNKELKTSEITENHHHHHYGSFLFEQICD